MRTFLRLLLLASASAFQTPQSSRRGALSANLRNYINYPDDDYQYNFNPFVGDYERRNYVTRDTNNGYRDSPYRDYSSRNVDPPLRSSRSRDIPIPAGRSANQLARMYDGLSANSNGFNSFTVVERYFEAYNRRNIPLALSCFDDFVYYDDTQFSKSFEGKEELAQHLIYLVDCLPEEWRVVLDGLSVGNSRRSYDRVVSGRRNNENRRFDYTDSDETSRNYLTIAALWHVENNNGILPYSRGCSFYRINPSTNLIAEAYDFPESAVIKPGSSGLKLLSIASKLTEEPVRFVPFILWVTYLYVVFCSNGILPGKDIFHADARTWEEVRALSLNFMYISPILGMKLSPSVHPCLEAVFNTLLAWSFLFLGFLSDERTGVGSDYERYYEPYYERLSQRREEVLDDGRVLVPPVSPTKRNLVSILPTIIGMQFLTSAFLLPYLFCRTSERALVVTDRRTPLLIRPLYKEELDKSANVVGEWRGLGIIGGIVGLVGVYWFFNGRIAEFGPPLWESPKRMQSFMKLLSIDRTGATFLVDLVIFWLFQGWLVDDDWRRRGRSMEDERFLRNVAKFVPFWGLACYLTFRPKLPSRSELDISEIDSRGFLNSRGRGNANNFFGGGVDFGRGFGEFGRNNFNGFGGRNDGYNQRRREEFDNRGGRGRRRRR